MKDGCQGNWHGMRLICAGAVVFLVGLVIILFKEFNIPRYWTPAVIGIVLMLAGVVVHGIKRSCKHGETESK